MADRKPPKFVDDERATLLGLLQYQRESLVRKVDGVTNADVRRAFVPSGTSLLWLVKHMRGAEVRWLTWSFAGEGDFAVDAVLPGDTLVRAVDDYRAMWKVSDAIVHGAASLDERCRRPTPGDPVVNLRWVLAHLLEETARHAGHADIIRELIDGSTGR